MNWVMVSDELPGEGDGPFIYLNHNGFMAIFNGDLDAEFCAKYCVVKWMPAPDPRTGYNRFSVNLTVIRDRAMKTNDMKVCKIEDERLSEYTNRTRSGREQVFYTGNDSRDWDRFRAEGGNTGKHVEMHDKPDVIRLQPPERHYYAELIDGEWWWLNGCAECNGRPRDWMTYIECENHDVCRTCKTPRAEFKASVWGGKNGWQCNSCQTIEADALKREKLEAVASKEYDPWDYRCTDDVVCPHCEASYSPDCEHPEGEQECDVCGGKYSVEPEYTVTYSTEVIGERVTQ